MGGNGRQVGGVCLGMVCLGLCAQGAPEGGEAEGKEALSLEQFLRTPVTVASWRPVTLLQAPGIVTLLTRQEILDSGAKDLQDLLRLVPGFEAVADTQGNVTVAFRGNWGNNGKVLILVDGFETNDLLVGSLYLDNTFPLDNVRGIEIIRGPGSAMYGGFGEIAVVNIHTRPGSQLRGTSGGYDYGWTRESFAHRNAFVAWGDQVGELEFALAWHGREGNRSDRVYTDRTGKTLDMTGTSELNDHVTKLHLGYRGLTLRYLEDHLKMNEPRQSLTNPSLLAQGKLAVLEFNHKYFDARYTFRPTETVELMPKLTWRQSNPYFYEHQEGIRKYLIDRRTAGFKGAWTPRENLNLVFGYEAYREDARFRGLASLLGPPVYAGFQGQSDARFTNQAVYAEMIWWTPLGEWTVGGRYDHHSATGGAFAPRLAYTRTFGKNHVKLLAARAFRAPASKQIGDTATIVPETANTYEVEYGRRLSENLLAIVNLFHIQISNPYYFDYLANTTRSGGQVSTAGAEGVLQYRGTRGYVTFSSSYYQAGHNTVSAYQVPPSSDPTPGQWSKSLFGVSRWKHTLMGHLRMTEALAFTATAVAIGPRMGQPESFAPTYVNRPGDVVVDAFLHYRIPTRNFEFSAGVHNLTDADHDFVGANFKGSLPLLPGPTREYALRLIYNFW